MTCVKPNKSNLNLIEVYIFKYSLFKNNFENNQEINMVKNKSRIFFKYLMGTTTNWTILKTKTRTIKAEKIYYCKNFF